MKLLTIKILLIVLIFSSLFLSCEKAIMDEQVSSKPVETFEYLWEEVDQHYSFFDYKQVNWDQIHQIYSSKINDEMSEYELFHHLFEMLTKLKDGHVNLISHFNVSRYEFYLEGKNNYNERLIRENYISKYYYQTGPFLHDYVQDKNIGYIRYNSFADDVSQYSLDLMLSRFADSEGIILDLRQNGGGKVTNVFRILEHFVASDTEVYKSYIKKGPAHNDFSEAQIATVSPEGQYSYTQQPIIILTDRGSFSATSFFALACRAIPNVYLVGDTTGGGLGAPSGGQLPNGWTYRISVTKTLSMDYENFENGVPPDYFAELDDNNVLLGKDDVIEKAIEVIHSK